MLSKTIFIASSTADEHCTGPVKALLKEWGYTPLSYFSDRVANAQIHLAIRIPAQGKATITYNGQDIDVTRIKSAWYRRPNDFNIASKPLRAASLADHYKELQEYLWQQIPARSWFNKPAAMRHARTKLLQLEMAHKVGFLTPETVVANTYEPITGLPGDRVVLKMPGLAPVLSIDSFKSLYSTIIAKDALPKQLLPYPGIWQTYLSKKREWRVTVVGDQVFSLAIYTRGRAQEDWRLHQLNRKTVRFAEEKLPESVQRQCVAIAKKFDLVYGAIDLIETEDGRMIFLEINPNGQFGWLQSYTSAITEAIAKHLVALAER